MINCDVAIIGAGPYGLSLAAHLNTLGVDHLVFGTPMEFWANHMPPRMFLKSDGGSSDLSDPASSYTWPIFCAEQKLPFAVERPIPSTEFVAYGRAFQRRMVTRLDTRNVRAVRRIGETFTIELEDGEMAGARRIVVATGIAPFRYIPEVFNALSPEQISHSVNYGPVDSLKGRKIAVVGSGASAVDLAAAINEAGIEVTLVARRDKLKFQGAPESPPRKPPLYRRIMVPDSPVGGGWNHWFYCNLPLVYHALPEARRLEIARTALGPKSGWFMRERVEGKFTVLTGCDIRGASRVGNGLSLAFEHNGRREEIKFDHVVAATGYRPDLKRLSFLDAPLCDAIAVAGGAPKLTAHFASSVPEIYFLGGIAAPSFGPLMRFVAGARFAAHQAARSLARRSARMHEPSPALSYAAGE